MPTPDQLRQKIAETTRTTKAADERAEDLESVVIPRLEDQAATLGGRANLVVVSLDSLPPCAAQACESVTCSAGSVTRGDVLCSDAELVESLRAQLASNPRTASAQVHIVPDSELADLREGGLAR